MLTHNFLNKFEGANPKNRLFSVVEVEPGQAVPFHVHNGENETYYFLSGVGEYSDNGTIVPIAAGMTANAPFPDINDYMDKQIKDRGLIYASLFQGFPYADVSCSTASVCVVSEKGAQEAAEDIARFVWERRNYFNPNTLTAAQAFDLAEKVEEDGYIYSFSSTMLGRIPANARTSFNRKNVEKNIIAKLDEEYSKGPYDEVTYENFNYELTIDENGKYALICYLDVSYKENYGDCYSLLSERISLLIQQA